MYPYVTYKNLKDDMKNKSTSQMKRVFIAGALLVAQAAWSQSAIVKMIVAFPPEI